MFLGGWSFSCQSTWYPDVDDTAAVIIALLKQDPESAISTCIMKAANVRETCLSSSTYQHTALTLALYRIYYFSFSTIRQETLNRKTS